jgi:hypothetical protein
LKIVKQNTGKVTSKKAVTANAPFKRSELCVTGVESRRETAALRKSPGFQALDAFMRLSFPVGR